MDMVTEHDGFCTVDDRENAAKATEDSFGGCAWKLVLSDNEERLIELHKVLDALTVIISVKICWKTHNAFSFPVVCRFLYASCGAA